MQACPQCGHTLFRVGRYVTIWQTLVVEIVDGNRKYTEVEEELHDILDADDFSGAAEYMECGKEVRLEDLWL
jgi:hypothetical protein